MSLLDLFNYVHNGRVEKKIIKSALFLHFSCNQLTSVPVAR